MDNQISDLRFCSGTLQNLFYVTYSELLLVLVSHFQHFWYTLKFCFIPGKYLWSKGDFCKISWCFAAEWDEWEWRAESGQFFAPTRCIFSPPGSANGRPRGGNCLNVLGQCHSGTRPCLAFSWPMALRPIFSEAFYYISQQSGRRHNYASCI